MKMAARWSSEHVVADHRDLQANTMAVDCTGQYAVLAGRRYVAVIQLDQPIAPVKKIIRHSKWEVNAAEWSPHQPELFVLACNQRAELFLWNNGDIHHQNILRAHTRAISDLNWSTFDSNVLATASIDTYIHLWDIRDPRKPSISLSAVAGASQVKWNKIIPNMIATSHEGDIRLWDSRKGTYPVQYITAHLSKIHSIDWSPTQENQLATSSQDCTVKFWDVTSPKKKDNMLSSGCPVWRARYTPFGYGLVTVVVPPLRRGENSLLLWNIENLSNPVHTFVGHSDVVMEFGWRKQVEDSKDFQLVTWARDQSLRIWTVDLQLQKLCGHDEMDDEDLEQLLEPVIGIDSQDITDNTSQASQTSPRETEAGGMSTPPTSPLKLRHRNGDVHHTPKDLTPTTPTAQPQNLLREFSLLNMNIPNITIDEMDAKKRTCTVTAISGKHIVCLKLSFPASYPYNASPTFYFCKGTTVEEEIKTKLLKVLRMVSQQQVRRNRSCLEPCLRQLVSTLETFTGDDKEQKMPESPYHLDSVKQTYIPTPMYGFQDASVPFPRTSGARFCGADLLVVFTRPLHLQRINAPTDVTPRSLSALAAYLTSHVIPIKSRTSSSSPAQYTLYPPIAQSPSGETSVSISSFYHRDRKQKLHRSRHERKSSGQKINNSGAVLVYSVSRLMPIDYNLAQNYVFNSHDIVSMCTKNASVAAMTGCMDLVQVWSLVALQANPLLGPSLDPDSAVPWSYHPCGRKMLQSLIFHYIELYDVQTAAMLTCAFNTKSNEQNKNKKSVDHASGSSGSQLSGKWWLKPGGSPYHTVVPADTTSESWTVGAALKRNRSNSWSDSIEEYRFLEPFADPKDSEREIHEENIKLLDPKLNSQYDQFKKAYADILYRWNLLEQRAQVLKHVSAIPEKHKGVEFITECLNCHKDVQGAQCTSCKHYSFSCVICRVAVKGCSSFCMACGHGGHTNHLEEWFSDMDVCPAGCGCKCLEESDIFGS